MANRTGLLAWLPVLAWAGLIFALSAQADLRFLPDQGLDLVVRKIGHAGVFGILALFVWWALASTTPFGRPAVWALLITILYAATDEIHQGFVSGRHPSPVDVGIDSLGACVATAVVLAIAAQRRRASRT